MKHSLSPCEKWLKTSFKTTFITGNNRFGILLIFALCLPLSGALAQVSPVDSGMRDREKQEQQTETTVQTTTEDAVDNSNFRILIHLGETNDYIDTNIGFEISFDGKLIKNWVNWGMIINTHTVADDAVTTGVDSYMMGLYASGYAPINYLVGSGNKNLGLFPYVRVGVGYYWGEVYTPLQDEEFSDIDIFSGLGVDWKVTKGFGLSLYLAEFEFLYWGITILF